MRTSYLYLSRLPISHPTAWAQYLSVASDTVDRSFNFARIGATVDSTLVDAGPIESFVDQVVTFREYFSSADSEIMWTSNGTLFTLFFGVNDM